ncbi:MAG: response regulator [Proteobacteria bacterium]|jgi:CheY-like chemotaxis protein|nr:response regulator [Desulfocapsa sp.]MBU3943274.1 response regulator [Pseudomonadota bacterium]MCG2744442.1 response regulator [Desulfobacteraceae bacterium]MBU4027753.1 response regulator [Pseudomonadota bacterium]MBU4042824.1 response regulator [Pseudomonadota bacterium]
MPSIAILSSSFTNSSEIVDELSVLSGCQVITDQDVILKAADKQGVNAQKLERALSGKKSVFNEFTLEQERCLSMLKATIADILKENDRKLFVGLITHLIPSEITHVVKVLLFDSKANRIENGVASGLSKTDVHKEIKKSDVAAFGLTDFLFKKEAWDASLYDVVIPVATMTPKEAVQLILTCRQKETVKKTESSLQATEDMALIAQVELALLAKGHNIEVYAQNGNVILTVNKSVLLFDKLVSELSSIVSEVESVKGVEVVKGKDYKTSIYRKQKFELPSKVLLVDDEKELAQTISERLINRDVGTYAVHDGQQALNLIASDDSRPDVMVLDLRMPGMDGIEVLRKTKEIKSNIEIIILTGHGTQKDREICMELGAFAYLQKPVDIEELSATIYEAHKKAASNQH